MRNPNKELTYEEFLSALGIIQSTMASVMYEIYLTVRNQEQDNRRS